MQYIPSFPPHPPSLTLHGVAQLYESMLSCYLPRLGEGAAQLGGDVSHADAHDGGLIQEEGVCLTGGRGTGGGVQRVDGTAPTVLLAELLKQLQHKLIFKNNYCCLSTTLFQAVACLELAEPGSLPWSRVWLP